MIVTKKQLIKLIREQIEEQNDDFTISKITRKKFSEIPNVFGIVINGAGGNLLEWINGINDIWIEEKIAPENLTPSKWIKRAYLLSDNVNGSGGRKDLVIEMKTVPGLSVGKLAIWRLRFGGITWIEDFIVNYQRDYISQNSSKAIDESNDFEENNEIIDNQMLFNLPFSKKIKRTIYRKYLKESDFSAHDFKRQDLSAADTLKKIRLLKKDIEKTKQSLIKKANKKGGVWEDFGQNER